MRPNLFTLIALVGLSACFIPMGTINPGEEPPPPLTDAGPTPVGVTKSKKARVRFKGPERLTSDFSAALGVSPTALCNELGLYSCATLVHPLSLGGVDPYGSGLYEPLANTGVTTPVVVDRIALSACGVRVVADRQTPAAAVIFKDITVGNDGKLANVDEAPVRDAVVALYRRAMLRDPSADEIARHLQLARDVHTSSSSTPAVDWMKASCFVVLTSAESVFY